jgi:two-component system nitrogen regulation response regulator GlnG
MSPDLQAKLLRVLQESEVTPVGGSDPQPIDVRIIAATHRDLDVAVREGRFREDLLYRLRVVPLHMSALRDRREDVRLLAEHFAARYSEELTGRRRMVAPDALAFLERYDWPGNVRELENAIKRAMVLSSADLLTAQDFAFLEESAAPRGESASLERLVEEQVEGALAEGERRVYRDVMERVERPLIESVLQRTEGNQIRAAALLGINRNTLRKKIVELGIALPGRS